MMSSKDAPFFIFGHIPELRRMGRCVPRRVRSPRTVWSMSFCVFCPHSWRPQDGTTGSTTNCLFPFSAFPRYAGWDGMLHNGPKSADRLGASCTLLKSIGWNNVLQGVYDGSEVCRIASTLHASIVHVPEVRRMRPHVSQWFQSPYNHLKSAFIPWPCFHISIMGQRIPW